MSGLRLGLDVGPDQVSGALVDGAGTVLDAGTGGAVDEVVARLAARVTRVERVVVSTSLPAELTGPEAAPARVGVLRIGAPASTSVPPLTGWPGSLAAAVRGPVRLVRGGHLYDGAEFGPLDVAAVAEFGEACRGTVGAVAVAAVHAGVNPAHELRARALLGDLLGPGTPVLTSHEVGGSGLLERENTAVLDAALAPAAQRFTDDVAGVLAAAGIDADLYLTGGDGTVQPASSVVRHPLHLLGAPHGSARSGVAHLTGLGTFVVVELAGRVLRLSAQLDGQPVESGLLTEVHGVRTSVRAVRTVELRRGTARRLGDSLAAAVDRVGAGLPAAPLVLVGAGDEPTLPSARAVLRPAHGAVAAAYGAATGEASGTVDRLFWPGAGGVAECAATARRAARDAAIRSGADPALVRVGEVREALMTYVPVRCVRLRVTATGPIVAAEQTAEQTVGEPGAAEWSR